MLTITQERLPPDLQRQHAILRDYFCDIDAAATLQGNNWHLSLGWPAGGGRHVDPALAEGLAWWGDGVSEGTMALARRREGRVLSALYDTWTLHRCSVWASKRGVDERRVIILHIDDHRDLSSPRIFVDSDGWLDAISQRPVDFFDPGSVEAAVNSGAAGMGSFLTPILHALQRVEVRHLCQPPKATVTTDFDVVLTTQPDTLIDPGRPRLAVRLDGSESGQSLVKYRLTPDLQDWLDDIDGADRVAVLLHVDMDYFNNRYDGDSDWLSRKAPLDPPLEGIIQRIDEVCDALSQAGLIERIEEAVVAYSPGFFPAEFWAPATQRLRTHLRELYTD